MREREVLVLREVERWSCAEIGALLGLPPGGAAVLAWRARGRLLATLGRVVVRVRTPACARALTLLELREDGPLATVDAGWLGDHLASCPSCGRARALLAEAAEAYRAWEPAPSPPLPGEVVLARAHEGLASGGRAPPDAPA